MTNPESTNGSQETWKLTLLEKRPPPEPHRVVSNKNAKNRLWECIFKGQGIFRESLNILYIYIYKYFGLIF